MKAKHQRLVLALAALVAIGGSSVLAMSAMRDKASYFQSPADIEKNGMPQGKVIRLGGMVTNGSLVRASDGVTIDFLVHDEKGEVPVRFTGIAPDLFKEGSGVVAEGSFSGKTFVASNLLAKHDERYMPPKAEGAAHKTTTLEE